jgi:IBR domain, a half RING-finger domain/Zinc finger, C3HC4 type (RING finger)
LPENVTEQHLFRRTRADDVTIQESLYTTAQVKRHLAKLLSTYGTLVSWEMSPARCGANKLYAFAKYTSVQESRKALEALSNGSHNSIKFYASLVKSIKYSIRDDVWQVLEPHVRDVINNNNANVDRALSVRLSLYDVDEVTHVNRKFRIYGKEIKTLGKVKAAIDTLVRGEIFVHNEAVFWHELFESASGTQFINTLSPAGVAVSIDMRTRTIRFYGDTEQRETIKATIVDHVTALNAEQAKISLGRAELRYLLSGGLQTLQRVLGEESVRLNITNSPELFLNKRDMVRAISLIRSESQSAPRANPLPQKDCSVCFCEVEEPVDLECGHSCCANCITHYISSALRSRSVPVNCITCNKPIALSILRQFREFDDLLLASFKRYLSINPTVFENCPTADCPQIYRIGSVSETVVQCSECLAEICTSCKVIWHEGMTCAEMKESLNPDSVRNKQLMAKLGIHACPRCSTNIEKISGCNHMTCGACKTHICWICKKDFGLNNGARVYEHIREEHGDRLFQ